jgi:hypothetical protein
MRKNFSAMGNQVTQNRDWDFSSCAARYSHRVTSGSWASARKLPASRNANVRSSAAAIVLATISAALSPSVANSQMVAVVGTGTAKCGKYLTEISAKPEAEREYFSWAQGYMSGILLSAPPGVDDSLQLITEKLPVASQINFMRQFCGQKPDTSYSDGVEALYRALGGTAIR